MKLAQVICLSLLPALMFTGPRLQSADSNLTLPVQTRFGVVDIGLGLETTSTNVSMQKDGNTTSFFIGDYKIEVTESTTKQRSIVRVKVGTNKNQAFSLSDFSIKLRIPKHTFAGIWYPGSDVSSSTMMSADPQRSFITMSDANFGVPYLGAVTSSGTSALAMGMGHQDLSVVMSGEPLDDWYELQIRATTPRTASSFDERFYISKDSSLNWFDAAAKYADWVDSYIRYNQFPISSRSYEPLYDTWYWTGDRVNSDLYLKTAEISSEAGVGFFLADSGWDAPPGEWSKWLEGQTGNYSPPPNEFPNLTDTFQSIRMQYGMGVQLWLQPFAVGRASKRYAGTRELHSQIPVNFNSVMAHSGVASAPFVLPLDNNLETVNLCPRMSETVTYLKNLFTEVAQKYNPEGYWLDFIDGMATYCIAPHRHTYASFGEGFRQSLEAIKSTILAFNPDAIVQFRARYANLNTKSYANAWQSEDSPGSYDQMRLNALRLRPFSKGVVFKADELYWPPGTPDSQIGKFIMTSVMTGVPAFGSNLLLSSESELSMLRAWLVFYRDHKNDLVNGRFIPFGGSIQMPNHKIEGIGTTYAYIRNLDSTNIVAEGDTVYVMNATSDSTFAFRVRVASGVDEYDATILNRYLDPQPGNTRSAVDAHRVVTFQGSVDEGGMVILRPVHTTVIEDRNRSARKTPNR